MNVCAEHDSLLWIPDGGSLPNMAKVREAVANGSLILDQLWPNWTENVDTQRLEVQDPYRCVLGQLYGSYSRGCEVLDIGGLGAAFGFASQANLYDTLDMAWKELIEERRNAVTV